MLFQIPGRPRQRRGPSEVVGVDLGTTGFKAVRVRRSKEGMHVLAADVLPVQWPEEDKPETAHLTLPRQLLTNYTALALSGDNAAVRIISVPGHSDKTPLDEAHLREQVGLGDEFRVAHAVCMQAQKSKKAESKLLVVGLPEQEAQVVLGMVASGPPAPVSLEVSGVAAFNAFLKGPGAQHAQDAVGVIESGAKVTFMAFFNKGILNLVRKFDFGSETLVAKVQQQMGVDRETAQGIISDGAFDISQPVHDVMDPFLRQMLISRDFVERKEECRVAAVYLSGGACLSRWWQEEMRSAAGVDVRLWNPFDGMTIAAGAYPEAWQGRETVFTAAVGACLGVLGET